MSSADTDWPADQHTRLRTFLRWLIAFAAGFGLLESAAFLRYQDRAFGIASLTTFVCLGCFLLALRQLRSGGAGRAAAMLYAALLGAALVGAVVWPNLLSMLVLLPLLALVIVLPYLSGRPLASLLLAGWLVIVSISVLDEFLVPASTAPSWLISLLRVSSISVAAGLFLLLLTQFSSRLMEMLWATEEANASLRATQAELKAQQLQLQRSLEEREAAVAQHRAVEERLSALSEAASTLLGFPHERHVLTAVLDLARQAIEADAYAVWRVHPTLPEWHIVASVGLSEAYQQQAARNLDGTRVIPLDATPIADIETSAVLVAHRREEYRHEGIRALLVMPLLLHGEQGGTLVFYYRAPHPFSELELRVATALSHLAAAALSTAELYDEQHRLRLEAEAAQADLAFLVQASGILGGSLDYPTTLSNIAQLAVPRLADWCGVYLLDGAGALQELAVAHQDPAKAELARELTRRYPPTADRARGLMQVIRSGEPAIVPHFDAAIESVAEDAEHLRLLSALGIGSYLLAPLGAGGRTFGAMAFGREGHQERFGPRHLPLVQELAQRAASAVEHARLYREAQEAIQQREQFLSVASHELKTPLTSLIGYTELMQRRTAREGSLPEREQRTLRLIREQGGRLEQLIGSLLDISRIERGQLRLERAPTDLAMLAQGLIAALQPTLEQHRLVLEGAEQPLIIHGDALRLEQVAQNLIGNAIKYSPRGGTITVQLRRQGDQALLVVTDQGIGIPAAALPHLFQRFYRSPNADAQYISGMGIGLYVVHEIVTLHGGSVAAASEEGVGSRFTVVLPLANPYPSAARGAAAQPEPQVASE